MPPCHPPLTEPGPARPQAIPRGSVPHGRPIHSRACSPQALALISAGAAVCTISGCPLRRPTAAITQDGRVHHAYADRETGSHLALGVSAALGHAALLSAVVGGLAVHTCGRSSLIVLILAWGALHRRLHAYFWHTGACAGRRRLGHHD